MKKNRKRSKLRAIHDHCLECAGGSAKEVTLCHLTDCPLWEYRTGNHVSSPVYKRRMESAERNCPEDFAELRGLFDKCPDSDRLCDDMKQGAN